MVFSRGATIAAAAVLGTLFLFGLTGCVIDDSPSSSSKNPAATVTPESIAPASTITANITIANVDTNGENVSVGGYVSGIVEDGGICTFVLTDSVTKATVTVTGTGISNARTTSCGTHQSPIASFTKGSWTIVLSYKSDKASAKSSATSLEIP